MIQRHWRRGQRLTAGQYAEVADAADRFTRLKARPPLYVEHRPSGAVIGMRKPRQLHRAKAGEAVAGTVSIAAKFVRFESLWGGFGSNAAETITANVLDDDGFFTVPIEVALPYGVRPPPQFTRGGINYTYFSPQSRSARRSSDGLTIVQFLVPPYIIGDLLLIERVGASVARAINPSTGTLRDDVVWLEQPGQWARGWVQN